MFSKIAELFKKPEKKEEVRYFPVFPTYYERDPPKYTKEDYEFIIKHDFDDKYVYLVEEQNGERGLRYRLDQIERDEEVIKLTVTRKWKYLIEWDNQTRNWMDEDELERHIELTKELEEDSNGKV